MPALRTPEDIGVLLAKKRGGHRREWLAQQLAHESADVQLPLNVSRKAAAADIVGFNRVQMHWRTLVQETDGLRLRLRDVDWRELGIGQVPSHVIVLTHAALFALMPDGREAWREQQRALTRLADLTRSGREALARALLEEGRAVFDVGDEDFERLVAVVLWLSGHCPADCYIRQIPVEGVDTKWLEANRSLTARLLSGVTARSIGASELLSLWRLRVPPTLIRLRHAHTLVPGLPPDELVALPVSVLQRACFERVCVVENLQTGLCLQVPSEVPIVCGMGTAVKALGQVQGMRSARIFYAGDLDQHGLHILAQLRGMCRCVSSVLMDVQTLTRYASLAVTDPTARLEPPAEGLTHDELALYERLDAQRLRLEQERLPLALVNRAFALALNVNDSDEGDKR